jgi:hypothetical protein
MGGRPTPLDAEGNAYIKPYAIALALGDTHRYLRGDHHADNQNREVIKV